MDSVHQPHIGIVVGQNFQSGRLVFGAQLDVEYLGDKSIFISEIAGTAVRDDVQVEMTAHALARVGYDVGGGWLPYVTGGAVLARVTAAHTGYISPTDSFTWSQTDNRISYTLGGGIEKQFGDGGWSLRAEYLYDYWGAKHYDWVPNQRYSDIALRIDTFRLTAVKRL